MQPSHVPTKTPAGTDEISTRRHRLSTRSRTILIAIDGHHSVAQLQTMFASFGDIGLLLDELAALGLVEGGAAASATKTAPQSIPAAAAPAPQRPVPAAASNEGQAASSTESPLMQARQLMNQVAVESLGFRAFGFTLKLEHCYSAHELRGLLPTFVQLVTKAKGTAVAAELQQRIERMIANA